MIFAINLYSKLPFGTLHKHSPTFAVMAFTPNQTLEIIEALEQFLDIRRPPEHIRPQLDMGYRIDGQSVTIVEIRPVWNDPKRIQEIAVAKTTYVQSSGTWKVYWMLGNLKWHAYDPQAVVSSIKTFTELVDEDRYGCFFG